MKQSQIFEQEADVSAVPPHVRELLVLMGV
jgi:hypothetical protein